MRPWLQAGRDNIRKALDRARAVLTPEQWKRLPDALKSPGFGGRARGGGRGEPFTEDYLKSQDGKQLFVIVSLDTDRGRSIEFRRVYDAVAS